MHQHTTTSDVDDRSLPAQMRELCRTALETRTPSVSLLHGGLGADFPAPIEWVLHVDPKTDEDDSWLRASLQLGSTISAYREEIHGYWDLSQIHEWLHRQQDDSTPGITGLDADIDMLLDAYARGWSVNRTINHQSHRIASKILGDQGRDLPLPVTYQFSAVNHFYNVEGHPEHRKNDTEISEELSLIIYLGADGTEQGRIALCQGNRVEPEYLLARIEQLPPWHARMARFDEDQEEWLL